MKARIDKSGRTAAQVSGGNDDVAHAIVDRLVPSRLREKYEFHNFGHALEILTQTEELNGIFRELGVMAKYGASTTWMGKLLYRLKARRNGGCPILAVGIRKPCITGTSE